MSDADYFEMKAQDMADETSRSLVYAILSAGHRIAATMTVKPEIQEAEDEKGVLKADMQFVGDAKEFVEMAMHDFYTDDPKVVVMKALSLLQLQRDNGSLETPNNRSFPYRQSLKMTHAEPTEADKTL